MGVSYIAISAACTVLSCIGLQLWTELSIDNLRSEKIIGENPFKTENAGRVSDLLLSSHVTVGLLANFALNVFVLLILFLKVSLLFILGALCCKRSMQLRTLNVNATIHNVCSLVLEGSLSLIVLYFLWPIIYFI